MRDPNTGARDVLRITFADHFARRRMGLTAQQFVSQSVSVSFARVPKLKELRNGMD
jgi:acyl-CoA synthetase (NDP forming)